MNPSQPMPWLGRSLRLAETFSRAAVWAGGALTLGAVFLIAYDILVRKFFNITVGGADEISSYVFAISTTWALAFVVLQRANVRVDVLYTLLHRLGLFRVAMFFTLDAAVLALASELRLAGVPSFQLDGLWPGVTDLPWASFLLYLLLITTTSVWCSWRAIKDKRDWGRYTGRVFRTLTWLNLFAGLGMVATGLWLAQSMQLVIASFGGIGVFAFVQMWRFARRRPEDPRWWLREHLTAMLGNGVALCLQLHTKTMLGKKALHQ